MNDLEGHMQKFGLYPKRLWRAIGRFWAAAQLGYSSGSVQSWLGGKKKIKQMEKKTNLKAVVIVQWEMIRMPNKWVEMKWRVLSQPGCIEGLRWPLWWLMETTDNIGAITREDKSREELVLFSLRCAAFEVHK